MVLLLFEPLFILIVLSDIQSGFSELIILHKDIGLNFNNAPRNKICCMILSGRLSVSVIQSYK